MPKRDGEQCSTCRHFNPRPEVSLTVGECRRYPPQPFQEPRQSLKPGAMQIVIVGYVPPAITTEWCGEWSPGLVGSQVAN